MRLGATARRTIRVLGVDDQEAIGRALGRRLAREPDLEWVGHLTSADGLIDAVGRLEPDIVLLDLDMPGRRPLEALEELSETRPRTKVVILSGHVRRELIDRSFEAGAWGYLSKNEEVTEIIAALRRVMVGVVAMSPEVAVALDS